MGAVEPRPRASPKDFGFCGPAVAGGLASATRRKNRHSGSASRPKRRRSRRSGRSDRARRGRRGALGPGGRRSRLAPSHHSPPLRRQDAGRHEDAGFAGGTAQRVGSEEALEGNDPVRVLLAAQRRGCAKSRATAIQILAPPRGEDAVVPDADEARGQDVLEEERGELRRERLPRPRRARVRAALTRGRREGRGSTARRPRVSSGYHSAGWARRWWRGNAKALPA